MNVYILPFLYSGLVSALNKGAESGLGGLKSTASQGSRTELTLPPASFLCMRLWSCSVPQIEVHTFSPSELSYFCSLVFKNKFLSTPGRSHAINISMQVF